MEQNEKISFFPAPKGDKVIWRILIILAIVSILSVYSSSYRDMMRAGALLPGILHHIAYLCMGFVAMYLLHLIPVRHLKKAAPIALLFCTLLLGIVFFVARRWIFGFQPSELAKIVMVVYLAKVISEGFGSKTAFFFLALLPVGLFCMLILNGHTSTSIMLGFCATLMIFIGVKEKIFLWCTILFIAVAGILYFSFEEYFGRSDTARNRIIRFFDKHFGEYDGRNESNSLVITQDKIAEFAIHSGGLCGKGPGNSKYRENLTQANNDFIYAIIVEEYGIVGGAIVVMLYFGLFYKTVLIIRRCKKVFSALTACGLILTIMLQALVHIAVSIGAVPVTGQNLPLISSGGSSIFVTCLAFGMILSISRQIDEQTKKEKQNKFNQGINKTTY